MCGIVGYNGCINGTKNVLKSLKKLEYRGYDSCGICLKNDSDYIIYRSVNRIESLMEKIKIESNLLIGHTRWATHGKSNIINCHPIVSYSKRFIIAHNGIIENYIELKNKYLSHLKFKTQTDTEVIANLLDAITITKNLKHSLKLLTKVLKGTYAIIIIDTFNQDKIYFVKNKSPLIIGLSNNIYLASDLNAFNEDIKYYIRLEDLDYGYITNKTYFLYNRKNIIKNKNNFIYTNELLIHKHYMEKEIYEQPKIINSYATKLIIDNNIIDIIKRSQIIYIIGSGTSFYCAELGAYFFNKIAKKESYAFQSSEITLEHVFNKNSTFILISQSGETADLICAMEKIEKLNVPIISITNVETSTIALKSTYNINILAGTEIAVASTKAYTSASFILYILSNKVIDKIVDFNNVDKKLRKVFNLKNKIFDIAKIIKNEKNIFFIGKNLDYLSAKEASLKLKEITYIHSECFASGELKHGPIALITKNTYVIVFNTLEKNNSLVRSTINEIASRGAKIIVISSDKCSYLDDNIIFESINDDLNFLPLAIIFQLLTYDTALLLNRDIDKPRNLAKSVTVL